MQPPEDLSTFMRDLYDCRACALDDDSLGHAIPPHGPLLERKVDVLLVGWNPQLRETEPKPDFETWCARGARALNPAHAPFRALVGRLLPSGYSLDDGRVANTRVWKWPTPTKRREDHERAKRCADRHLWREVQLLQPRLVITYDVDAAEFFLGRARDAGVPMEVPDSAMRSAIRGWCPSSAAWGWPLAILAVTGIRAKSTSQVDFIQRKGSELLLPSAG